MSRPGRGAARQAAWALGLCVALASGNALAQAGAGPALAAETQTAPSVAELARLARSLGSADRATRRVALEALSSLSEDALPALGARLAQLAGRELDRDGVLSALSEFRRVQGADAPDADVDLAKGILPVLERERGAPTLLAAELVALLRALEAQKSPAAADLIVGRLFALDGKLFRYELPRTQQRLSVLLIPALIRHQTHPKPWVRAFCAETLQAMGVASPGRAVQQDDVVLLAAILDAYGDTLTFDAMPVVVSYVTDERLEVRSAARRAVERFGRNAIWQIRERYLNASGHDADPNWNYKRTLAELYRLHDEPRQRAFDAALERAKQALASGAAEDAQRSLDAALVADPAAASAKQAAPLYAQLAEQALARDELGPALALYRRALRLDDATPLASTLRARIAYLEGELRLTEGVVDLSRYRQAEALDPGFEPAREALDELTGERSARELRLRRMLGLAAAVFMAIAGFALLRRMRREDPGPEPADAQPSDDAEQPGETA
jgi:hypothetical protein